MQETKTIYVPDELGDDARAFFAQYNLYASVYCGNTDRPGQRRGKKIVCRYCNRSAPQTSFSNISHGIPQFTGNTGYIAVDECDQCNEMFSVYESDLAHFLGVSRTMYDMKGKRGVPKFKSKDKEAVTVEHEGKQDGEYASVLVRTDSLKTPVMTVDLEKKCVEIRLTKPPYIPVNVYKALVKMGMAVMPQDELQHFELTMRYLSEPDFHKRLKGLAVAYIQQTEYWYKEPVAYLFKKIDLEGLYPTFIFAVHLHNFFIQVVIPLCKPDFPMYKQPTQVAVRFVPVFITTEPRGLFRRTSACAVNLEGDESKSEEEIFTAEFTLKKEHEEMLRANPDLVARIEQEKIVAARIYFGK